MQYSIDGTMFILIFILTREIRGIAYRTFTAYHCQTSGSQSFVYVNMCVYRMNLLVCLHVALRKRVCVVLHVCHYQSRLYLCSCEQSYIIENPNGEK